MKPHVLFTLFCCLLFNISYADSFTQQHCSEVRQKLFNYAALYKQALQQHDRERLKQLRKEKKLLEHQQEHKKEQHKEHKKEEKPANVHHLDETAAAQGS